MLQSQCAACDTFAFLVYCLTHCFLLIVAIDVYFPSSHLVSVTFGRNLTSPHSNPCKFPTSFSYLRPKITSQQTKLRKERNRDDFRGKSKGREGGKEEGEKTRHFFSYFLKSSYSCLGGGGQAGTRTLTLKS